MKKTLLLLAAAAATTLAGCATTDATPTTGEAKEEAVYRTGSNIPTRQKSGTGEGVSVYGQEALDRARTETPQVPRAGIPGARPGS